MRGTLIAVVGPSGAGKDTLIDAVRAARPDIHVPTRAITRAADAGGEVIEALDRDTFAARRTAGGFALDWEAHGLCYGIPAGIEAHLSAGRHVLFNGSRGVIGQVRDRFTPCLILVVMAPAEVLAARLAGRGRETQADIAARLSRARYAMPRGPDVVAIDNGGTLDAAVADMLAALPGCATSADGSSR